MKEKNYEPSTPLSKTIDKEIIDNYQDKEEEDDFSSEDREKTKRLMHPYRKYQLWILAFSLIVIILGIKVFKLNSKLNKLMLNQNDLLSQVTNLDNERKEIKKLHERIELNYKSIYGLDLEPNIEIIHDLSELTLLSNFIYEKTPISYYICYKSSLHGGSAEQMRKNCNGLSPLVFLIETTDGYRFGGYTTIPFNEQGGKGYREDSESFIFSFDTKKKYEIEQTSKAILDIKGGFPGFGEKDIFIGKDFLDGANSVTMFPVSYEKDKDKDRDYILNGGANKFKIKEIEVLNAFIYYKEPDWV